MAADAVDPGRAAARALRTVSARAERARPAALDRWRRAVGHLDADHDTAHGAALAGAGRLTINFHPDRVTAAGRTVAAGLRSQGRYESQWTTGISGGSRSAVPGGERQRFERALFGRAYDGVDPAVVAMPVYGAFDLLHDPHGGSPRFGSCHLVLHPSVLDRTTLCVGDSHTGPGDVGTPTAPWSVLAALAEQAGRRSLLDRPLGVADLLGVLAGHRPARTPGRHLDGYVEAQVHGGVELARDVVAVVLDPCYAGTTVADDLAVAAERFGFALHWHEGSVLPVDDVPADVRGPSMPALARRVAGPDAVVTARHIGVAAARVPLPPPGPAGDAAGSDLQQLKYLWHVVFAHGRPAASV